MRLARHGGPGLSDAHSTGLTIERLLYRKMQRNLETKARCADLQEAARRAADLGAVRFGTLLQRDTYAAVGEGRRLKLREWQQLLSSGRQESGADLIDYRREDRAAARVSLFNVRPVADAQGALAAMVADHGLRGTVVKRRDLWLTGQTRIHLDEVEGLGEFVEVETAVDHLPTARTEHERICTGLRIEPPERVAVSYVDLLIEGGPACRLAQSPGD